MAQQTGPRGKVSSFILVKGSPLIFLHQNLTGQVKILLQPGQNYQLAIGYGALTDVFKGELQQAGIPTVIRTSLF